MNHAALKNNAQELSSLASFLVEIKDNDEYLNTNKRWR